METISLITQKGGTGKTTACINLAAGIASAGHKTLLIDIDPQANTTLSMGIDLDSLKTSVYEVLLGETPLGEVFQKNSNGVTIAPAGAELTNAVISLEGHQDRLRGILKEHRAKFDYILIDCPPALNLLTINALVASDHVISPMLCDYLSIEGLKQLMRTVDRIKKDFNSKLRVLGILPNMVDRRRNLTDEVLKLVHKQFKDLVFKTEIPVCAALAEAASFGKDIFSYARHSTGAEAYEKLSKEILRRTGR